VSITLLGVTKAKTLMLRSRTRQNRQILEYSSLAHISIMPI